MAESGDTILVHSGTYEEICRIEKDSITIRGLGDQIPNINQIELRDVNDFTIRRCECDMISAYNIDGFTIDGCKCCIDGFNLDNVAISGCECGLVDIEEGNNFRIDSNVFTYVSGGRRGIYMTGSGRTLKDEIISDCVIFNNTFLSSDIYVDDGSRFKIEGNTFVSGKIILQYIPGCEIVNNTMTGNHNDDHMISICSPALNCYITNNVIKGDEDSAHGILLGSRDAVVTNNTISGLGCGIGIYGYGELNVNHNTISNCYTGINIGSTNTNLDNENSFSVSCNTLALNDYGMVVNNPGSVQIIGNNFLDNRLQNAIAESYDVSWDNGKEGNYWSDYNSLDDDSDGIGDKPYINLGKGCKDHYPLMESNDACGSGIPILSHTSTPSQTPILTATSTSAKTPTRTTFEPTKTLSKIIPGFEAILGILCLIAISCLFSRRK